MEYKELVEKIEQQYKELRDVRGVISSYDDEIKVIKDTQTQIKDQEKALLKYIESLILLTPDKKHKSDTNKYTMSIVKKTSQKVDEKRLQNNFHDTYIEYSKVVRKLDLVRFKKENPNHSVIEKIEKTTMQVRDNMKKEK